MHPTFAEWDFCSTACQCLNERTLIELCTTHLFSLVISHRFGTCGVKKDGRA